MPSYSLAHELSTWERSIAANKRDFVAGDNDPFLSWISFIIDGYVWVALISTSFPLTTVRQL